MQLEIEEMSISKNSRLECSTEQDYARLIALLDGLIDQVGEDETHPLASMMDVIGVLIENYEADHVLELDEVG